MTTKTKRKTRTASRRTEIVSGSLGQNVTEKLADIRVALKQHPGEGFPEILRLFDKTLTRTQRMLYLATVIPVKDRDHWNAVALAHGDLLAGMARMLWRERKVR